MEHQHRPVDACWPEWLPPATETAHYSENSTRLTNPVLPFWSSRAPYIYISPKQSKSDGCSYGVQSYTSLRTEARPKCSLEIRNNSPTQIAEQRNECIVPAVSFLPGVKYDHCSSHKHMLRKGSGPDTRHIVG